MNENNNMEEVPLDLFSQVSLDDYEKAEDIPQAEEHAETPVPAPSGPGVISIPLNAYEVVRAKEREKEEAAKRAAMQAQAAQRVQAAPAPQAPVQQTVAQAATNVAQTNINQ